MDHKYIQSMFSPNTCGICKRAELDHTDTATCECCSNIGPMEIFTIPNTTVKMLMCPVCIEKEIVGQKELKENAENRIQESNLSMQQRLEQVKHEIIQQSDIFNAKIPSLIEIQASVDADDSIPADQKTFAKARAILDLFNHLKSVIIEANKVRDTALNIQRASQSELNTLASQLRQEERDKLKLQDITYKLTVPRLIKTANKVPRKIKVKFDLDELNRYATELQVPSSAIATMATKRGCTVAEAATILKGMLG